MPIQGHVLRQGRRISLETMTDFYQNIKICKNVVLFFSINGTF
jgi:hypothetical protein